MLTVLWFSTSRNNVINKAAWTINEAAWTRCLIHSRIDAIRMKPGSSSVGPGISARAGALSRLPTDRPSFGRHRQIHMAAVV